MPPPQVRTSPPRRNYDGTVNPPPSSPPGCETYPGGIPHDPNLVTLAARSGSNAALVHIQMARMVAASCPGRSHALLPGNNLPVVPPPAADDYALAELVDARGGDRVATELVDALAWIESRLAALGRAVAGGELGAIARMAELATLHQAYLGRLAAVRAMLGQEAEPIAPIALAGLLGHLAPHCDGPIRARIAESIRLARRDLDQVEADLVDVRRVAGDDDAYAAYTLDGKPITHRGAQDSALDRLATLLRRKRELTSRIDLLEEDRTATTRVVAQRVQAAVQAAGGAARVADAVVAAEILCDRTPGTLGPTRAVVIAGEDAHGSLGRQLDALVAAGIAEGPALEDLRARLAEATEHLLSARESSTSAHRASAEALVRLATEGDEPARAELEGLTIASPRAFPAGFASAIADARFDRAALAELAQALAG